MIRVSILAVVTIFLQNCRADFDVRFYNRKERYNFEAVESQNSREQDYHRDFELNNPTLRPEGFTREGDDTGDDQSSYDASLKDWKIVKDS